MTVAVLDSAWSRSLYCKRWVRKLLIKAIIGPSPIAALSFEISLAWDTQSNAFVESKRIISVWPWLFMVNARSCTTSANWVWLTSRYGNHAGEV